MIILMPRLGDAHIFSYRMTNGNWRVRCGKILPKDITMITSGADNTYPELCDICRVHEDEVFRSSLNHDLRTTFNIFESHLFSLRRHLQNEEMGPKDTYYYLINKKWPKLKKIKEIIKKR